PSCPSNVNTLHCPIVMEDADDPNDRTKSCAGYRSKLADTTSDTLLAGIPGIEKGRLTSVFVNPTYPIRASPRDLIARSCSLLYPLGSLQTSDPGSETETEVAFANTPLTLMETGT